jgi:hypothetical protein
MLYCRQTGEMPVLRFKQVDETLTLRDTPISEILTRDSKMLALLYK